MCHEIEDARARESLANGRSDRAGDRVERATDRDSRPTGYPCTSDVAIASPGAQTRLAGGSYPNPRERDPGLQSPSTSVSMSSAGTCVVGAAISNASRTSTSSSE